MRAYSVARAFIYWAAGSADELGVEAAILSLVLGTGQF